VGDSACFSFFPTKNLGAFGDGGLFTTNDDSLATAARSLRNHGFSPKHHSRRLGGNFRLDALQAAILRVKLPHLERWNALRRGHAEAYRRALAELEPQLTLPRENEGRTHVYNQYVLRSAERDALRSHLFERGIATEIYYPIPIHLQDVCAQLGHHVGDFPIAEACARECLALPIFPELEAWMICGLTEAIHDFFKP
jgi:dTDP-4-amino-4,6-dideoxygalactose transaminase